MEDTIGYEALFSTLEWAAVTSGDWSLLDETDEEVTW